MHLRLKSKRDLHVEMRACAAIIDYARVVKKRMLLGLAARISGNTPSSRAPISNALAVWPRSLQHSLLASSLRAYINELKPPMSREA